MLYFYLLYENVLLEFGFNGMWIEYQGYFMFFESCLLVYLFVLVGFFYFFVDCIVKCVKNYYI